LTARSHALARTMWTAVGGAPRAVDRVGFTTPRAVPCAFPVADLASGAVATAPLAIAELVSVEGSGLSFHYGGPPLERDLV
jgi:hypothetical protein